jgi:hypothetical protein
MAMAVVTLKTATSSLTEYKTERRKCEPIFSILHIQSVYILKRKRKTPVIKVSPLQTTF